MNQVEQVPRKRLHFCLDKIIFFINNMLMCFETNAAKAKEKDRHIPTGEIVVIILPFTF